MPIVCVMLVGGTECEYPLHPGSNLISSPCPPVCVLNSFTAESTCASFGDFAENEGPKCGLDNSNDGCVGGQCGIPQAMRFFKSDDAAAAASGRAGTTARTTGGYSNVR